MPTQTDAVQALLFAAGPQLMFSLVVLAPSGILFGVIWARTRNLFVAIAVHAASDLLPNLSAFIELWR